MKRQVLRGVSAAAVTLFACQAAGADASLQSATVLEFADPDTLFVADSDAGRIHAVTLPAPTEIADPAAPRPYNVEGLGGLIADALGVGAGAISYNDLAVRPSTAVAYVAISVQTEDGAKGMVVEVDPDGGVSALDVAASPGASVDLENQADDGVTFWRDVPASTLAVTDLDYVDGSLFVSGLSTGEFASTLRVIPFPFEERVFPRPRAEKGATASIEIFHTAHGQNETRAPIRAMTVVDLDGSPTVVAAYTCTPLVTIPVAALEDGAHVTGKTIAELGYGNTPLEVLSFTAYNMEQQPEQFVLVINREYDADLIALGDLTEAAQGEGLTEPFGYLGQTLGVNTTPIPMAGVFQAADQDPQFLLTLKRNMDTGAMDLVSYRKGAYMRLSDFISEYNFPDYVYNDDPMSDGTRQFQNMLKADEGYADLVR